MEENKRDQTWFGLAMILCGALVSIPSLILGGSLVSGMSLPVAILTGLAGYGFIVLMMISQGMQSVDQVSQQWWLPSRYLVRLDRRR